MKNIIAQFVFMSTEGAPSYSALQTENNRLNAENKQLQAQISEERKNISGAVKRRTLGNPNPKNPFEVPGQTENLKRIQSLEEQLSKIRTSEIDPLQLEIYKLQIENTSLREQLSKALTISVEGAKSSKVGDSLTENLRVVQSQNVELNASVNQLNATILECSKNKIEMDARIAELSQTVKSLEGRNSELDARNRALQIETANARSDLAAVQGRLEVAMSQIPAVPVADAEDEQKYDMACKIIYLHAFPIRTANQTETAYYNAVDEQLRPIIEYAKTKRNVDSKWATMLTEIEKYKRYLAKQIGKGKPRVEGVTRDDNAMQIM